MQYTIANYVVSKHLSEILSSQLHLFLLAFVDFLCRKYFKLQNESHSSTIYLLNVEKCCKNSKDVETWGLYILPVTFNLDSSL